MAKVILICGKICSGKSYYARQLAAERKARILSVDEEMLKINPTGLFGDKHEEVAAEVKAQLLAQCVELTKNGVQVILDWGYWKRQDRRDAEAHGLSGFRRRTFHWHPLGGVHQEVLYYAYRQHDGASGAHDRVGGRGAADLSLFPANSGADRGVCHIQFQDQKGRI